MNNKNYLELSRWQTFFLSACVGVIVASLFYIQPIEKLITASFNISDSTTGLIAMLTQISYALGLLLVVPLGDLFNRYYFLQVMEIISIIALILAAFSPNALLFAFASILVGLTSVGGQIIIPYVAYLTPVKKQGPVLGAMISGMLTGILFSRTFSGLIAARLGWHQVYLIAALMNLLFLILMHFWVPNDPRKKVKDKTYFSIIASIPKLIKKHRYLRSAAINGFTMFGIANLLWSTLAFFVYDRSHWGNAAVGALGLLGLVAIIAAPFIGKMVDLYSAKTNITIGIGLGIIAYLIFAIFSHSLIAIIIGIVFLDLSTQFSQVTDQAIIQSINREENSRNNSIFMFSYFFGGSMGTLLGINAWQKFGWSGVIILAFIFLLIALINHLIIGEPEELGK